MAQSIRLKKVETITLSDEQADFFPWLIDKFVRRGERYARLIGNAGTGKTTVMKNLLERWRIMFGRGDNIMWCCPSHQAKGVLSRSLGNVEAVTMASALGLGPKVIDGKYAFKAIYPSKINARAMDVEKLVVVVDEASMVDHYSLSLLEHSAAAHILFVGDDAQLPPVGLSYSPVFAASFEAPTYRLTEVFRQGKNSPILAVAEAIRNGGYDTTRENGIENIELREDRIAEFYERYEGGIALCPTHSIKDMCNKVQRKRLNGGVIPDTLYNYGERVLLESPVNPPDGLQNTELAYIMTDPIIGEFMGFRVWTMFLSRSMDDENEQMYFARVPYDDNERKAVEKRLRDLESEYGRVTTTEERKGEINREVQMLSVSIVMVSHGYAMTVHKSQGSTFEHVLFCASGFYNFRKARVLERLVYTGITRASKTLVVAR